MFEGLKDAKKLGASVAAAGALAVGVGTTTAEAAPITNQDAIATATVPEYRESIQDLTAQSVERLKAGEPINFYRGVVEIVDTNTNTQKVQIENPIIIYRNGATAENSDFAAGHPRSKFWAIGYIERDNQPSSPDSVGAGNLGHGNLVLLPYNNNGNNFIFHKQESKVPLKGPAIDLVQFNRLKGGGLDLNQPLDSQTNALYDFEQHPLPVGELVGPGGKGFDPNAPGIEGKGGGPSANH